MRARVSVALLVLLGCGRVDYEPDADASDAELDGADDARNDAAIDAGEDADEEDAGEDDAGDAAIDGAGDADARPDLTESEIEAMAESGAITYEPSNVALEFDPSAAPLMVGGTATPYVHLNCDTGEIKAFATPSGLGSTETAVVRTAGAATREGITYLQAPQTGPEPSLGVFVIGSLDVAADGVVGFDGARPCVLLVSGRATIRGRVTATHDTEVFYYNPPAGSYPRAGEDGPGAGSLGTISGSFGGGCSGGSYGTSGGDGGTGVMDTVAGATPSGPVGDSSLVPLFGGSAGGGCEPGAYSCGGGGAFQISARVRIDVLLGATVDAGGQGGKSQGTGGGGGGSGGAILLEAPIVEIAGFVSVNGGSGASPIANGTDASPTLAPVSGPRGDANRGSGGTGSDAMGIAGAGEPGLNSGGGGGGGAGRIRIRSLLRSPFDRGLLPEPSSGAIRIDTNLD